MVTAGLKPLPLIEVPFVEAAVEQIADIAAEAATRHCAALLERPARHPGDARRASWAFCAARPSVVGFDGIALGEDLTPALATITQPNHDIGRRSVELLVGALAERRPVDAAQSVLLPHGFRVGESCGAAPA